MIVPKFSAKIENGKLILDEPAVFDLWLSFSEGKNVEVVVSRKKRAKTQPQLAYYWAVVVKMIADETGDDTDSTHSLLKSMHLKSYKIVNKKRYTVIGSVSKLTTVRMIEYLDKCKRWAAQELNIYIPDPSKVNLESEGDNL